MAFWTNGMMPPPQTRVMKIPEAAAVYLPSPSVERLKIEPHMMEVQRPQRVRNSRLRGALPMVTDSGMKMARRMNRMAAEEV